MSWAYRTGSYANNGAGVVVASGSTTTVTLGAAVSAGDMLSLHVITLNTLDLQTPTITVSDSVNGAWGTADATVPQTVVSLAERQSVFSFPNSAAGTPVITVTVSNSTSRNMNVGLQCAAFSGMATTAPLDVAVVIGGTSSTPSSGNTATTGAVNELVLGFYGDYGENDTITKGTSFTLAGSHPSDPGKYEALMEYKDSGAIGVQAADVTLSATNSGWAMFAVVYKVAVASNSLAANLTPLTFGATGTEINSGPLATNLTSLVFAAANSTTPAHHYSTTFPNAETPISENNVWNNGAAVGLDWANVNTTTGKAFGTESGNNTTTTIGVTPNKYDDSTAILKGTFTPDQWIQATVFNNDTAASDHAREAELRLRSNVSGHSSTGYEVEYSCDPANPYFDIVRWNGQVGDFTPLTLSTGGTHLASMPGGAAVTGDVLRAEIIGSTIYGYKNGVLMASATDTTYTTGNPGMGFYLNNRTASGTASTYGFSQWAASDLESGPLGATLTGLQMYASNVKSTGYLLLMGVG